MRSKNCLSFFLQESTFRKFLILLLFYLPVGLRQISSAIAIIFANCHGLSCVHVRVSWYTAPFLIFLRGVRPRCIGLARKISAPCNTGSYVFSFFFILIFILLLAISHMYVILIPSARSLRFGSRLWKVNIDQNWNLLYHYLFLERTPAIYDFVSQEDVFLLAIYFH